MELYIGTAVIVLTLAVMAFDGIGIIRNKRVYGEIIKSADENHLLDTMRIAADLKNGNCIRLFVVILYFATELWLLPFEYCLLSFAAALLICLTVRKFIRLNGTTYLRFVKHCLKIGYSEEELKEMVRFHLKRDNNGHTWIEL